MSDDTKVWPTGLTWPEAQEIHKHIIDGTRVFGAIALVAHLLSYVWSPWLH
jgi:light-harvesting protein B-800-850 beta chain